MAANGRERVRPEAPNQVWRDFVSDQLGAGRRLRGLTVVDIFTRECLAIEVVWGLKGGDVVRVLQRISGRLRSPESGVL